jgi:hypothetical protein
MDKQFNKEFLIFAKYLCGVSPGEQEISLYCEAMRQQHFDSNPLDQKLQTFALKYPLLLGPMDAGTALLFPDSVLRKKILVALAILECLPQYSSFFINKKEGPASFMNFISNSILAVFHAVSGLFLLLLLKTVYGRK